MKERISNMNKPAGYDEAQVLGEFTPINLGGHKLVIMKVEEVTANNGNQYLKISFDTAKDDVQPNYYSNSYKNNTMDNKKWSGVTTVFPTDRDGKTSKSFKTFCTAVEHSNSGFKMVWGDQFCNALKGKAVGGVFGEEEYVGNDGTIKTARKLFWFRGIDKVMDAEIPAKRTVEPQPASNDGFMNIPDSIDNELPFN